VAIDKDAEETEYVPKAEESDKKKTETKEEKKEVKKEEVVEKTEKKEEKVETKAPSKVVIDEKLKAESEKLKKELIENLNKLDDVNLDETIKEEEDPKVKLFTVTNPVKAGGHIRYTV